MRRHLTEMDRDKKDDDIKLIASRSVWRNNSFNYYSKVKTVISLDYTLVARQINKKYLSNCYIRNKTTRPLCLAKMFYE